MNYFHSKDGLTEMLKGNLVKTYKRKKLKHVTEAASDVDLNQDDMDIENDEDIERPVLFPQPPSESNTPELLENAEPTALKDSDKQNSDTGSSNVVPEDGEIADSTALSLNELQQRKLELLRALADNSDNTNSPAFDSPADGGVVSETAVETEKTDKSNVENTEATQSNETVTKDESTSNDKDNETLDEAATCGSGSIATKKDSPHPSSANESNQVNGSDNESTSESTDSENSQIDAPSTPTGTGIGRSRIALSGTPLLKQVSPFSALPSSEKWSVGVSDVIDFENLPDSTGTYKRLSGLITKVRTVVKKINDENDAEDDNNDN